VSGSFHFPGNIGTKSSGTDNVFFTFRVRIELEKALAIERDRQLAVWHQAQIGRDLFSFSIFLAVFFFVSNLVAPPGLSETICFFVPKSSAVCFKFTS
jgi:hypothetical protein